MSLVYCKLIPLVNPLFGVVTRISLFPPTPTIIPSSTVSAGGRLLSNTARPKFSTTAPAYFTEDQPENPRKNYNSRGARPARPLRWWRGLHPPSRVVFDSQRGAVSQAKESPPWMTMSRLLPM